MKEPVRPTMYFPLAQWPDSPMFLASISLAVRPKSGHPVSLTRSVAAAIGEVDPHLALTFRPLAEQVNASLVQERVVAILSFLFGGLALVLAALGIYGVTAYAVARRRTEIGIRMALGAAPRGVVALVLSRVAVLVGGGVIVGIVVSAWAARFVGALLYQVSPRDPVTLGVAAAVLAAVGPLAGGLPARRAARTDPAAVLREA